MRDQAPIFTSISTAPRRIYATFFQAPRTSSDNLEEPTREFPVTQGRHSDPDMHEAGEILNDCGAKRASRIVVPTGALSSPERHAACLRPASWQSWEPDRGDGSRTAVRYCRSPQSDEAGRRWPRNRHRLSGECAGKTEGAPPGRGSRFPEQPV